MNDNNLSFGVKVFIWKISSTANIATRHTLVMTFVRNIVRGYDIEILRRSKQAHSQTS